MRSERTVGVMLLPAAAAFPVAAFIFGNRSRRSRSLGLFPGYVVAEALAPLAS